MNEPSNSPAPVRPAVDLRDMLRSHIRRRALACMDAAAERRRQALRTGEITPYRQKIAASVRGFYNGPFAAGPDAPPPEVRVVGRVERDGFAVENLLFQTEPGWEVNANLYLPTHCDGPFPGVVVAVGHSGKQFENYQLPSQYFALAGFAAICFDPPGQTSEKRPGNDHFIDGVRAYLLGDTSSRYFIADAIRCIDVLATRDDVDTSAGVALTGVSGGGTTTTLTALLDDRIAVAGPSCCLTPLADGDITRAYAGCPETHPIARYARGVDEIDLLCAASPLPMLLMQGETDEVFAIDSVRQLSDKVASFYAAGAAADRYELFVDAGRGHCYSLDQARTFARFANRWLLGQPDRPVPPPDDPRIAILPEDQIACRPRTDVNMRTLYTARADRLAESRDRSPQAVRRAAAEVAHVDSPPQAPPAELGPPQSLWQHDWQSVLLKPEPDIELPGTFLRPWNTPAPALLVFDDAGRERLLRTNGPLSRAIPILPDDRTPLALLSVDLRGWGDSAPAVYPYELVGWGSPDRWLAYTSASLDDGVLAMRIRDGLASLAWLREQDGIDAAAIRLVGIGLGGVVALHVAAIDAHFGGSLAGVVCRESLTSFRDLLAAESYTWPADAFLPGALERYDLPDLAAAAGCDVRLLNPRDGQGQAVTKEELSAVQSLYGEAARVSLGDPGERVSVLH